MYETLEGRVQQFPPTDLLRLGTLKLIYLMHCKDHLSCVGGRTGTSVCLSVQHVRTCFKKKSADLSEGNRLVSYSRPLERTPPPHRTASSPLLLYLPPVRMKYRLTRPISSRPIGYHYGRPERREAVGGVIDAAELLSPEPYIM